MAAMALQLATHPTIHIISAELVGSWENALQEKHLVPLPLRNHRRCCHEKPMDHSDGIEWEHPRTTLIRATEVRTMFAAAGIVTKQQPCPSAFTDFFPLHRQHV
ncbi:uncharacterized protein EAE98_003362 [Botrytis deweyae]|uniref:Uncharacterized protein n=1 Tax=Botrytis deweyae TaxID=2478750 RepID=A0ABQ7IU50_9HELO|nr:uncharacterized protein EAE98_003362 [Botrytis deweyae]KAF7933653.1 hypothetical protein EAE98_003362 [Botrytis deweyae]